MKIYSSIYIGSYQVSLKVFEVARDKKLRELDYLRSHMPVLSDIYSNGDLSSELLDEIIDTINDMKKTVEMYRGEKPDIFAGISLMQAKNAHIVLDRIKLNCGLDVNILDNSRQRFLVYVALSSQKVFSDVIKNGRSVMADIGGSNLQLTLFEDGKLINTQHISLGLSEMVYDLRHLEAKTDFREQMSEMLSKEISVFYNMFLKKVPPERLIIIDNQLLGIGKLTKDQRLGLVSAKDYLKAIKKSVKNHLYNVNSDEIALTSLLLFQSIIEKLPVNTVYAPPVTVHEGAVTSFAIKERLMKSPRDFEADIMSAAWAISRRYHSYEPHLKALEKTAGMIFDTTKRYHGLGNRSRLLLSVAAVLHDCGKYISISEASRCTYAIIRSSEILGLDDKERELIAWMTVFHRAHMQSYDELADRFSREEYMTMVKLVAILRVANAMDKSHKQKMRKIKMRIDTRNQLIITIDAEDSLTLERGMFGEKTGLFEETFGLKPILREKRI